MAVYTDVSDGELTHFIAQYDLGAVLACKGIAEGVENSNYLIQTEQASFILTLYEKRVAEADLPFFLGLMEHLAARGFICPTPIKGRDGTVLRRLCGRPAVLISFLEGLWPRTVEPFHCTGVGDALARFHLAGADFPMRRANNLSLSGWRPLVDATRDRADEVAPGLAAELEAELTALETIWPRDLPIGVCHADMFPDNVFFRDEAVSGVIDFYFACTEFMVYDLAICLNAWAFDGESTFNPAKAAALVQAYQARRPLSDAERLALPVLARGSALRFLLTRLYDWLNQQPGALVRPKDPREYLRKLRFHRTISHAEQYGL